jgi:hypothetical protein
MKIRLPYVLPLLLAAAASPASAATINFDDQGLVGPDLYVNASPSPQTVVVPTGGNAVTFNGGVILTNTRFLPQNTSSIYGSAHFGIGLSNPMTISFLNPITNFLVDVQNGRRDPSNYRVQDNLGNSQDFMLDGFGGGGGFTTIGFAAVGNLVTISSLDEQGANWNFFVDNIRFDLQIDCGRTGCAPTVVPVPAALPLFLAGALGIAGFGYRRSRKQD